MRKSDSTTVLFPTIVTSDRSDIDVNNRAIAIFKEIDTQHRGYLSVEDLEDIFRSKQTNVV